MGFKSIFPSKSVIGMIHLSGDNKVQRALDELALYEEEGLHGAIVENYHGSIEQVEQVLQESDRMKIKIGINLLGSPVDSFKMASRYNLPFIQIDSVQPPLFPLAQYSLLRSEFPLISVLGGIEFKYVPPSGNSLEEDLEIGQSRCDAIVTTGPGTGIETPTDKLRRYRSLLGKFPLVSGAGVNPGNIRTQLTYADAVIVGSYFKQDHKDTELPISRTHVRTLMSLVNS